MGRDKALLPLPDGRRLWERQLDVLRALGPAELFFSGPPRQGASSLATLLADETPGLGPLAGVAAALSAMRSKRLVVLAVDLPTMTTAFLRGLLVDEKGQPTSGGKIPQASDGFFEPLAAVYPKAALSEIQTGLRGEDRSLQGCIRRLIESGLVFAQPISAAESDLFTNWNAPGDVSL